MSNALNSFSPDKKRPHGKGPKIRVLPCSRFAYVKIQTLQCFSQVARRQGQSRWGRCWTSYRAAGGEGQPRPAPITGNSAAAHGIAISKPSAKATNPGRLQTQLCVRAVLEKFPEIAGFFHNVITTAPIAIANAEFLLGEQCDGSNFIHLKKIIDRINRSNWTRDKDTSEGQSGVSVLGGISETLLSNV